MKFILLILVFSVTACTSTSETRKDLNEIYQGAGVEQYFLSDLPEWANFTTLGSCHRSGTIRFFNFKNLSASYALDYEQALQLQYMYNRGLQKASFEQEKKVFNSEDESFIFYNSYEQIIGGGREFVLPKYRRVHVVWIDEAIDNKNTMARLKKLLESPAMEAGHPVLLSMCLSYDKLERFVQKNGFDTYGVKFISMEMFTPYNRNFEMNTFFDIDLEQVMTGKEVHFFAPYIPVQYQSKNNIRKY